MNISTTTTARPGPLRFWGPTLGTGIAATAAVAALFTGIATAAAAPAPERDAVPAAVDDDTSGSVLVPCFGPRFSWNDALAGPPPTCSVRYGAINEAART